MAARKYFVLVQQETDGIWGVEFGDYDRECVDFELQDRRDHGVAKRFLKILTCGAKQADINAAVAKLNACA